MDSIIEAIEDWFRGIRILAPAPYKMEREAMLTTKSMISYYENDHGDMKQSMIAEFADVLGTIVEYLICGVIKAPELDADSVELLKLFGAMDEKTKQIMLVQMRAVARF